MVRAHRATCLKVGCDGYKIPAIDPEDNDAHDNLMLIYLKVGRTGDACREAKIFVIKGTIPASWHWRIISASASRDEQ